MIFTNTLKEHESLNQFLATAALLCVFVGGAL